MSKGPFAYVDAINRGVAIPVGKDYSQYIINKAFSYYPDTISFVEYICQFKLPDEAHFRFLLSTIRPRQRFSKWPKPVTSDEVQAVMDYYYVSKTQAEQYVSILEPTALAKIVETIKIKSAK